MSRKVASLNKSLDRLHQQKSKIFLQNVIRNTADVVLQKELKLLIYSIQRSRRQFANDVILLRLGDEFKIIVCRIRTRNI